MSRSLGMSAFRSLARGAARPGNDGESPPRPEGELVWMHASSAERLRALCDVAERLVGIRDGASVLITCRPGEDAGPGCGSGEAFTVALPPDLPTLARAFLNHWRPDVCLWTGGDLHPNLIAATHERGLRLFLADLLVEDLPTRRHRWLPNQSRRIFERFSGIYTPSQDVAAYLKRTGLTEPTVTLTSRLSASAAPPCCAENELSQTIDALGGRPVWLAAFARPSELDTILKAHETALRLLHRLLLVLAVETADDLDSVRATLGGSGLRVADWERGEALDETTQVLLTCSEHDLGLWYRVAPLSLIAGSLEAGSAGHDPRPAAALGSAVLHGPGVRDHAQTYDRMTHAGAAVRIRDADELAEAVLRLSAPDRSAAMALAGWQLVTEGAELTDLLIDLIQDALDDRSADHARS